MLCPILQHFLFPTSLNISHQSEVRKLVVDEVGELLLRPYAEFVAQGITEPLLILLEPIIVSITAEEVLKRQLFKREKEETTEQTHRQR